MLSDKKLLEEGVINFFFKKEVCRSLSNFWSCDVQILDDDVVRVYGSGENCFHGEKFIRIGQLCENEKRKKELMEYSKKFLKGVGEIDGNKVKKMGRHFILNNDELELWSKISVNVQLEICKYKFEHYEEVRNDLCVVSRGKVLIHPALRCSEENLKKRLWEGKGVVVGGKIEVLGRNMLGNLWMKLRDEN